jgi:hypothetical protein
MPDFNVRSDSVNVELIMEQIRERIREKRGVDYTEQQIRDLAAVKLERFLDPTGVRSDLLDQFRKALPAYEPPELPNYAFEDATLFESHRAPIRWLRKLLLPFLKLLFNPNPLIQALNIQSRLNTMSAEREARREATRRGMDQLYYELIHNLVIETTRLGIDNKNLKMRLESVSSRLEFNERRARALESVVVYKAPEPEDRPAQRAPAQTPYRSAPQPSYPPQTHAAPARSGPPQAPAPQAPAPVAATPAASPAQEPDTTSQGVPAEGPGQRSRRRRRRRGRRGGGPAAAVMGTPGTAPEASALEDSTEQMDAMDRMDDDGSPESEEAQDVAVERVEQALDTQTESADPFVDGAAASHEITPIAPVDVAEPSAIEEQPSLAVTEQAPVAVTEHAPPVVAEQAPSAVTEQAPLAVTEHAPPAVTEQAPPAVAEPPAPASSEPSPSTSSGQAVPDADRQ